jgi:hypothetical protein
MGRHLGETQEGGAVLFTGRLTDAWTLLGLFLGATAVRLGWAFGEWLLRKLF